MQKINFLLFSLLALFWSGSFITIHFSVAAFSPLFGAMMRIFIGLVFLTLIMWQQQFSFGVPKTIYWRLIIVALLAQGIPFACLFMGETAIAPAIAGIINSTTPIWALVINVIFLKEYDQLTIKKMTGLLIGIVGITLIFWPMLQHQKTHDTLTGLLLVLIMAISYALGAILNKRLLFGRASIPLQANLWHQTLVNFVFLSVISLLFKQWPTWQHFTHAHVALWSLLYLGLFSTAIAWIIFFHLLHAWDAVRASSVMYLVPLLAILWDQIFLHTIPPAVELYGAAAILLGVVLIQLSRGRACHEKTLIK